MLRALSSFVSGWGSRILRLLRTIANMSVLPEADWGEVAYPLPDNYSQPPASGANRDHKVVVWRRASA
ncbi:hypothetical protein D3C85_15730 [compost metagenome]